MIPKHLKAKKYYELGLFVGITSFNELELSISKLKTNKDKGDAFEVFTEAFIATSPIMQAEEVWPFESIPLDIKKRLLININKDKGIDGLYKRKSGGYVAYQSKYRKNRKRLTWDELSTFIGLSDSVDYRLIFSNSLLLPDDILNQRNNISCQRGSDLDGLDATDFFNINAWLSNSKIIAPKKTPKEHQAKAITAITNELASYSRTTAVMACGTGKSLVSLWVAEKLDSQSILILLPSLSLVRQLLKEWCYENSWDDFTYICVCSDKTVANDIDNIVENTADFGFPVTTNVKVLSEYLNNNDNRKIVFSTYQSASVVANSMSKGFTFDLGIFDEAHKTAGKKGKKFSFALDDNNVSIKKRLFLTATPKHYVLRNNKVRDDSLLYSMENEEFYGKTCYKLTFSEAANEGIICNYKVIISVTTNEDVTREALARGDVEIGDDYVRAKQIANQLSIKECLDKYGVKKIFTFHKSIASAKSFTKNDLEGISQHIPYLDTYHVNGKIKAGQRENLINEFRQSEFALMSNSRCLTEGVDVPAVDLVAFLSPKRSQVDVIQATGRAMRKSHGKETGYVLVPIYLQTETKETLADAINDSDFNEVFDVLNALQEQDQQLSISLCNLKENAIKAQGYNDNYFNEKIEINSDAIDLKEIKNAITTRIVHKLAPTWYERFSELNQYFEKFGHSELPKDYKNYKLIRWVNYQRKLNKINALPNDRFQKLKEIGFKWENQSAWDKKFKELKAFYKKHDTTLMPARTPSIGMWCVFQRQKYFRNELDLDQITQLNSIQFVWAPREENWEERYMELFKLHEKNSHCKIPHNFDNQVLIAWASLQRANYQSYKSSTDPTIRDRVDKLNSIDFQWSVNSIESQDQRFLDMLLKLEAFDQEYGHTRVSAKWEKDLELGRWVEYQRKAFRENKLPSYKKELLDEYGFDFSSFINQFSFQQRLNQILEYQKKYNANFIPRSYSTYGLGYWIYKQKKKYLKGELDIERANKLIQIGVKLNLNDVFEPSSVQVELWNMRFNELSLFKERFGHCDVPLTWHESKSLGSWVQRQRINFRNEKLSSERLELLVNLEFQFDTSIDSSDWGKRIIQLTEHIKKHGSLGVDRDHLETNQLYNWFNKQKKKFREGKLEISRAEELEKFLKIRLIKNHRNGPNKIQNELWLKRFSELKQYKKNFGHSNVPRACEDYIALASWVRSQRYVYKKRKMTSERIQLLESIEFQFNIPKTFPDWNGRFEELVKYKKSSGTLIIETNDNDRKQLRVWILNQILSARSGKLEKNKMELLSNIGINFSLKSKPMLWETKYNELKIFYKKNGHCDVPQLYTGVAGLGRWVNKQRQAYVKRKLSDKRVNLLNNIQFIWKKKRGEPTPPIKN